jgi:predicted GTPase
MVEPTKQPQYSNARNPDAAPSDKRLVLTIGDVGHGKSTFNNALIGAHKNEASDATSGVTQNFQTYSSILPEFKDTAFMDSPGLNDPDMALENWVQKYNNTVGKQSAPRLSLVVLLIECQARPTLAACVELAALLSCVTKLRAQNFAVVINKCAPRYTPAKAIEFF